jgi:hypothetical protein
VLLGTDVIELLFKNLSIASENNQEENEAKYAKNAAHIQLVKISQALESIIGK